MSYPLDRLYEEVAFVAYHFHWGGDELMSIDHAGRRRWVEEISRINARLSGNGTDT